MIIDRRTANPIARLRPIPETDGAMDHLRKPRPHELMLRALTRSSRAIRCFAFRAIDELVQIGQVKLSSGTQPCLAYAVIASINLAR